MEPLQIKVGTWEAKLDRQTLALSFEGGTMEDGLEALVVAQVFSAVSQAHSISAQMREAIDAAEGAEG